MLQGTLSVRRRGDHLLTQHLESDGRLRRPRQVVVAGHAPQHAHRVIPPQLPVFPAVQEGEEEGKIKDSWQSAKKNCGRRDI